MELSALIEKLRNERDQLDGIIASLQELRDPLASVKPRMKSRRGRKSMSAAERLQVAERMRCYWAVWRAARPG